ncbi:MAG: tRNA (N6-threonylcarbamoyladenosine(37)-N6)-methyltransferase TrmO [Oscillibacter sp.]|nr:tRNA (N6-threonylcarbamoyladenosine(37)-N6)-methyltransferase TrmO [Oscillibacter sp.]
MAETFSVRAVAKMRSDFPEKFGVPRQSGLVPALRGAVVFEPAYRSADAVRGLEEFSHIWLVWVFDRALREGFSPTVRPPRLGGNERKGVFATRSPFRPNAIAISCVELEKIDYEAEDGPVLIVRGADLADGTPILDVKPYLPYADAKPQATGSFASEAEAPKRVEIAPELLEKIPDDRREALLGVLAQDPRPRYQDDPARTYGFSFAGREVRFRVRGEVVTVTEIE